MTSTTLLTVQAAPVTSFGNEPFWLTAAKAVFVFVLLLLLTLFVIVFERKVVGRMQQRPGPNRVGPGGWLQSLADGLKLALKEEIIPALADKPVYVLAPLISAVPAFLAFSVIPFGPTVSVAGEQTALQLTDMPVAVLFIIACGSVGVFGIVLSGWASGSTYPLLGSLRSAAQVISYEVAMGLSLVAVFIYSGSLATGQIVDAQADQWYLLSLPVSFVIYVIAMVGETNRAPFDLPEAESELVGGFHTEYTSLKFAMFFLGEYINMVTVSALAVTLFLGGWRPPPPFSQVDWMSEGWFPMVWFLLKVFIFIFFFVWLRGTLPRMRYDQFMQLGWKVLIPVSLAWIMLVAGVKVAVDEFDTTGQVIAGAIAVALVVLLITTFSKPPVDPAPAQLVDPPTPIADGGFPLPPLDLVVPQTPRSLRQSAGGTGTVTVVQAAPEKEDGA